MGTPLIDYELLKSAGVGDIDFAALVGVSKPAANFWRTGKSSPHPLRMPKIEQRLALIRMAYDDGKLPLPPIGNPEERLIQLKTVLKQYVNK